MPTVALIAMPAFAPRERDGDGDEAAAAAAAAAAGAGVFVMLLGGPEELVVVAGVGSDLVFDSVEEISVVCTPEDLINVVCVVTEAALD